MNILAILLIPLFWGIVSAIPHNKEINLIKDELRNIDNQQNKNNNIDLEVVSPDKNELERDATRSKVWTRSLFSLLPKDRESSSDKEINEDILNPKGIIQNGLKLGKNFIDQIVQSVSKVIETFNSGLSDGKLHEISKRENKKPRNLIVINGRNKRLKSISDRKNTRKRKIIDQETLHSIIPQITVNNNQQRIKSKYNERLEIINNDGFKTKRRQLNTEADNVQRNKREDAFSKWLDNTEEYYFDYSEPPDITPKYEPIAINVKPISTTTAIDKTLDKSTPIKTYFDTDYEDLHSEKTNDKSYDYYTDLKKSSIPWHDYSVADEIIHSPSEFTVTVKKNTNDNNFKSNTKSIAKATTSETTGFEVNNKDIHIPSDWVIEYKTMNDKNDDILFFKEGSLIGDSASANAGIETVHENRNKPLNAGQQKLSILSVKDTIANENNNKPITTESATIIKTNAENVAINEKQEKLNIKTAIVNNKDASIQDNKATVSSSSSVTGIPYSADNLDTYEIHVPSEWFVNYQNLDDKVSFLEHHSDPIISTNSNTRNNATTEDQGKPINWTNELKVTREPDDKWPSLEANAKTSAVQATAVSTEKIENLSNKRNEETKILSLKDLTEKDETTASVIAHSNPNESIVEKQTLLNWNDDKKLLNIYKILESTSTDTKTVAITDNNKWKWESNNYEKVLNANSQLVVSDAGNAEATNTSENEKEHWKWNEEDKNHIVKNNTISDNKVTVSEANAYAITTTVNNKQKLENVKSIQNNVTLNNQEAIADAAVTISDDKHILKSDPKYNNPSITDDSTLDNKAAAFSTVNVDIAAATNNTNQQWNWNNEETTYGIKHNIRLNNKAAMFGEDNNKVANSATGNRNIEAAIQNEEKNRKFGENSSEITIRNNDITNKERNATFESIYNAEKIRTDKKLSWVSSEEEKYNLTLYNETATNIQVYPTATKTEDDNQKWKWDNELRNSSINDKVLLNNQTETSIAADSVIVNDNTSKIKEGLESKIFNDKNIVASNNKEITSVESDITSLPIFKHDQLKWDNKNNDQSVKNNVKSNSEIDSLGKNNLNTIKTISSNNDTWKWNNEDRILIDKSNYLTANKTASSEADVKASKTTENLRLLNFSNKDKNSSQSNKIMSNSQAAASDWTSASSWTVIENTRKESEESKSVSDYKIFKNRTAELDEVNVKDTTSITRDSSQSKLEKKDNDASVTNYVKSNKTVESTEGKTDVIASVENNRKKQKSNSNKETESVNEDLIMNDATATSSASNSGAKSIVVIDKQISKSENDSNDNSSVKISNTSNNKPNKFITKDNTDFLVILENNKKELEKNQSNKTQSVKDSLIVKTNATASAASNSYAALTIESDKQQSEAKEKSIGLNVDKNQQLKSNDNDATAFDKIRDHSELINNNKTQKDKEILSINYLAAKIAESNANAKETLESRKHESKLDGKSNDASIKQKVTSEIKEIGSAEVNNDETSASENNKKQQKSNKNITITIKDGLAINNQYTVSAASKANTESANRSYNQQLKMGDKNKNVDIKNNAESNRKESLSAEANSNLTIVVKNNRKQSESNNKTQSMRKDLNKNDQATATASATSNTDSVFASESNRQQSSLKNKNNNLNIKNNAELNRKETLSANASTNVTLNVENNQQQWESNNNKTQSVKDDLNDNDQAIASVKSSSNSASAIGSDRQESNLGNKESYSIIKNNITINNKTFASSEASATGVAAAIENEKKQWISDKIKTHEDVVSEIALTKNNVNRQVFDDKTLASSTTDTANTNLENKDKDSISEYNINEKGTLDNLDVLSDSLINKSITIISKDGSDNENKKKLADEISNKSESNIVEIQNDKKNETMEKLQRLGIKSNNLIEYGNSMTVSGVSVSDYIKVKSNTSKESNNKLSNGNDKGNNKKDDIDETVTKASSYYVNEKGFNTSIKDDTKLPEWKINSHGYQNLVSQEKAIASVTTETKTKSITKDDNKLLNERIKNNTFINEHSIGNSETNKSVASEVKVDLSYSEKEINKSSLENAKGLVSVIEKADINSVNRTDNKKYNENNDTKNNTDLRIAVESKSESNWNRTIDNDNLIIIPLKEREIINSLNITSNNLVNWLLRWKSIDKTKDSEKKLEQIDDADLIVMKKPYNRQDTIGITYVKDSIPPMILFRVIPTSLFDQVRKLIQQSEIVHVSYAES